MKALILVALICGSSLVDAQSGICAGLDPGEVLLLPYPGDCSKFYECYEGIATVHSCPSGEWFNAAVQSCDHPEDVSCNTFLCPPGVVDFFPYPGDCSSYIECYSGTPEHHSCPDPLWFNQYQKRCVYAPDSQCGPYEPTAPPLPTPSDCYGVPPGRYELRPYPGDCNMYIECYGSLESVFSCPPSLWFDNSRKMCDIPALSDCPYGSGTPAPPDDNYDDPRCADGNNEYWPDPDCTKFIECWNGHGYLFDCPSGLYFDGEYKVCEDPSVADCGRTPAPTVLPPTDPGWTPSPYCPWPSYERFLFPYPGDCTKYIVCWYGEMTVEVCPPDLWFNPVLEVCDYPYEAGCIP